MRYYMSEQMKFLIAYDASTCADDALNDLPRAGLPREADALIVNVQERWLPFPTRFETVEDTTLPTNSVGAKPARDEEEPQIKGEDKLLEILERASQKLNSYFPEWTTETLSLKGSPAREIIRLAKEREIDLIIIGSHGRTESRRFALGSVSQKIANEAACSVRIVRGQSWKKGSPSRLLIGLDGTNGAKAAVAEAARRMWIMGSEVRLVVVQDTPGNSSVWLNEYVEEAKKTLERAELSVTELIEAGDPKQIIAASAEEWGADCIFLGANGAEDSDENQLLGSVSTAIVARAHCTVEIVRQKQLQSNNA
jgi:nucleotide-binding universal stress UspA family protein